MFHSFTTRTWGSPRKTPYPAILSDNCPCSLCHRLLVLLQKSKYENGMKASPRYTALNYWNTQFFITLVLGPATNGDNIQTATWGCLRNREALYNLIFFLRLCRCVHKHVHVCVCVFISLCWGMDNHEEQVCARTCLCILSMIVPVYFYLGMMYRGACKQRLRKPGQWESSFVVGEDDKVTYKWLLNPPTCKLCLPKLDKWQSWWGWH